MSQAAAMATPEEMTVEAFFAWAAQQPETWELVDGVPRMMAPASPAHGTIQARTTYLLSRHLDDTRRPCRVATEVGVIPAVLGSSNVRVPDVAVACTPPDDSRWDFADPVAIVEVLSPGNARATRGNLYAYMTLPSLREILLLHSTRIRAELLAREPGGTWPAEPLALDDPAAELRLPSLGFTAPLAAFYAGTELAAAAAARA
jgi:Uma2 family endonuclease